MSLLSQLLNLTENDEEDDREYEKIYVAYEREKKVSKLILKTCQKCGLKVAEADHSSGVPDDRFSWSYDILYSDDDREATVLLDEADLEDLVKLSSSGLIEGKCEVSATKDYLLRLTFTVHKNIAGGDAKLD